MVKKTIFANFILLMLLVIILAGCSSDENPSAETQPHPSLANPASVYCEGLGFQEETRQNEIGSYGVCIFPDGTECDSWDFLAGRCGQEYSYCVQQGFALEATDANIGTCIFADGSTCAEYLYFQGECKPGDNKP